MRNVHSYVSKNSERALYTLHYIYCTVFVYCTVTNLALWLQQTNT